jgi:hypothetical protein
VGEIRGEQGPSGSVWISHRLDVVACQLRHYEENGLSRFSISGVVVVISGAERVVVPVV